VLFVTPEYNRSVPGVLKNAIDVGSRPYGQNAFDGKPTAVVSQTPHKLGAFGANHAVQQSCVFLNMPVLQQPEMYLNAAEVLDDSSALKSGDTAAFVDKFVDAFAAWIARVGAARTHG
jgi:chromate reductase, NAD(P)H dehydrogenase (quinone)